MRSVPFIFLTARSSRQDVIIGRQLGVDDYLIKPFEPDELLAKAELARTIRRVIERRELTQTTAARVLGTTQPKVSDLCRGRLEGFSMERLYRFLNDSRDF